MQNQQTAESDKIKKLHEHAPEEKQSDPGDSHVPRDQSYPRTKW